MRALLYAAVFVTALAGPASAEPVKLDEVGLGTIAAGFAFGPGPIDINIGVNNSIVTPTTIVNVLDVATQIGNAVAVNTSTVAAAFASNVNGYGGAKSAADFSTAFSAMP